MNKLEKHIINRLKHFLLKYKMDIVDGSDIKDDIFMSGDLVLVDLDDSSLSYYPHYWTSINDMLFSPDNIFMYSYYRTGRIADIRCCIGDSLEEIIIKMDLMGV
jgi:hypothetical protein